MKAALHVLHFIHSTHNYGIHFTSSDTDPIHTFVHFLDWTQNHLLPPILFPLLHIVTLVGALRLVLLFVAAPSSHFSNVEV